MKKLVVYYSLDGNTKFIAQAIAEAVGADILELKPKKEPNAKSPMKYLWGGRQVLMKEKPELKHFDTNPQDYDCLFIGTPVWAWTYAPALATFFTMGNLKGKKIALFCCSGGGKGKTLEKMKEQLSGNEFIGEMDFVEPLKQDKEQNAVLAAQWAKQIGNS
ncbi:MAG: NAD(P)H-dependent oxidoreductase [Candidatus Omnitrophica bacterium]|nr:NAD(P)H-dependent oxidoreductase [Candidatus Omnitrophota bacterium]